LDHATVDNRFKVIKFKSVTIPQNIFYKM